jgi:hypothetical protein
MVRWHWTYPHRGGGPPVDAKIAELIGWMARENPGLGYKRIQGELLGLGYRVWASTVQRVLRRLRIPPAPQSSGDTWRQFLRTRGATTLAYDFFHVDCAVTLRRVYGPAGRPVQRTEEIGGQVRSWQLIPREPLVRGSHLLLFDPVLEDLAGNSVSRVVDRFLAACAGRPRRSPCRSCRAGLALTDRI